MIERKELSKFWHHSFQILMLQIKMDFTPTDWTVDFGNKLIVQKLVPLMLLMHAAAFNGKIEIIKCLASLKDRFVV